MKSIVIKGLTKRYRHNVVFEDISTRLDNQYINFLVGPNGSGKSTFIKCLLGIVKYQGVIDKDGLQFSYCPEKVIIPSYIRLIDFLVLISAVKGINNTGALVKIDYYLNLFEINKYRNHYLISLSLGTRQKVLLIQALLPDADVYIFDEPLNGLDGRAQNILIEQFQQIYAAQKILIITTHHITKYAFPQVRLINFDN